MAMYKWNLVSTLALRLKNAYNKIIGTINTTTYAPPTNRATYILSHFRSLLVCL